METLPAVLDEVKEKGHWVTIKGTHVFVGPHANMRNLFSQRMSAGDKKDIKYQNAKGEKMVRKGYTATGKKKAKQNAHAKFSRVARVLKKHDYIGKVLENESTATSRRTFARTVSTALLLIYHAGIRPSNIDGGITEDAPTYGCLSLQKKHVSVAGAKITLRFRGKKGVKNNITVTDKKLATSLRDYVDSAKKATDPIFTTEQGEHLADDDLRNRMRKFHRAFKTKDLRTARAMLTASEMIPEVVKKFKGKMPDTRSAASLRATEIRMYIAERVSKRIGNEPNTSKTSYINPFVWEHVLKECGFTKEDAERLGRKGTVASESLNEGIAESHCPILTALFGEDAVDRWLEEYAADEDDTVA